MPVWFLALSLLTAVAAAQEPPPLQPIPDGPPAAAARKEDLAQPEVTIRRQREDIIEEHRVNGKLYMIRVIPRYGPPFYLLDSDGDGNMDSRYNELDPNLLIPGWVLFSW